MNKFINNILLSFSLLTIASGANASLINSSSLITNGSFELTTFNDNTQSNGVVFNTSLTAYDNKSRAWDVFETLPGWITTVGTGIELQKNVVTRSQNGQHHVELDSHPRGGSNSVMTQSLNSLIVGANYLLEFYYKPRTNQVNDNGINVYWYDSSNGFDISMNTNFVADGTRNTSPNWLLQSVLLTANSTTMDLSFGSFGKQNTLGGLIDNVSLVQVKRDNPNNITAVPEPPMIALFLVGLGLLVLRQRRRS